MKNPHPDLGLCNVSLETIQVLYLQSDSKIKAEWVRDSGDFVIYNSSSEIILRQITLKSTSNCLWVLKCNWTCCNNVGCGKYTLKLTWVVCYSFQWRVSFILLQQIYLRRISQERNRQLFKQDKWKLCNENFCVSGLQRDPLICTCDIITHEKGLPVEEPCSLG